MEWSSLPQTDEVIKRLPCEWQELFVLLRHPIDAQDKAQVWYDHNLSSKYGCYPEWCNVLESLSASEPFINQNGNLEFKPRFIVLPISTQRNFLIFLYRHVGSFPAAPVKAFLEEMSTESDMDMWLKLLKANLMKKVTYLLDSQMSVTVSLSDEAKLGFQTQPYTFSTEENRNMFHDLCNDIRSSSNSLPLQQSYKILKIKPAFSEEVLEVKVPSPLLVTSPLPQVGINEPHYPQPTIPSSEKATPAKEHNIQHAEGPAVKRLKLEASQSCSFLGTLADFSFSQITVPLTSHDWEMVARLKDIWRTCSSDTAAPEEIKLFLSCTAAQMKEVCAELELDNLNDVAMTVCCDHVCSLGDELSHGNCVEFLMAAVLPKVKSVTVTFPRSLCNDLVKLSEQFPRQLIDGVIIECLQEEESAICQAQMFCKLAKEVFTPANRIYLSQKLLDNDNVPISAGLLLMIQVLIDLKVDMDAPTILSLIHTLGEFSGGYAEDIKFGKLLLAFITKYGKQINSSNIERLKGIVGENRTFLKKAVLSAITRLEKTG